MKRTADPSRLKWRGRLGIILAALLLAVFGSGCVPEADGDATDTPEPGGRETFGPTEEAVDFGATATADQAERNEQALFETVETTTKEILVWLPPQFDPSTQAQSATTLGDLFTEFMSENQNISINYRIKDTGGEASELNMLSLAADAAPNVVPALVILDRNDMMTAVQKGLIYPIETDLFSEAETWFRFARESAFVDNVLYGIPVAGDPLVLAYRPALTGPDMNNWEEILTRGLPIGFEPNSVTDLFGLFIYVSLGGRTTDEQGKPWLDQEILTQTLNFFLNGGQKGAFPPAIAKDSNVGQSWKQFTDGTYQITVTRFSQYRHNRRPDFIAIPLPRTDNSSPYPLVNTWNVVITARSPEIQELAIELGKAIAASEFNDRWTFSGGYLPVRNTDLKNWGADSGYEGVSLMSEKGALIQSGNIIAKLVPILNSAISKVIQTTMTPEKAAAEAIEAVN